MSIQTSLEGTPIALSEQPQAPATPNSQPSDKDRQAKDYVIQWRNQLRTQRLERLNIWNECWALYRGQADYDNKEDWQSQVVLPKSWSTVKQAVNVIKRFMNTSQKPWFVDSVNPSDPVAQQRASQMTDLNKVFLDKAHFIEEFCVGLETGFIIGAAVYKVDWILKPRKRMRIVTSMQPAQPSQLTQPSGITSGLQQQPVDLQSPVPLGQSPFEPMQQANELYPTQLPNEAMLPFAGGGMQSQPLMIPVKQTVQEEILEGELSVKAVDPYNFYWLPGSKFNRWTGTIEEMEVPKWQLLEMADQGVWPLALIESIGPMQISETEKQSYLRFGELPQTTTGPTKDTGVVKLTEFFGPLVIDGHVIERNAHIIIANDTYVLFNGVNDKWHQKPPYCAFSPLQLPFRTEGIGLVEMVRSIDRALDKIINLGVDTLLFRLMPVFEMTPDIYENAEDLKTGLTPGKVLRRNNLSAGPELGLRPIPFEDVSPGAAQMAGILDRAHQEGGLVTELQQSLPRWSGAQTATETEAIQANQASFFGAMASDIEQYGIAPIIDMATDTVMQYIDTAKDPRVATILGVGQQVLAGMTQPEIMEMISGDYTTVVRGLSGQLEKAEMLQNLIQMMNIIGQNPESWMPWINQDNLLRRIFESFRPVIHDIDELIVDPQTAEANKQAMQQQAQMQQLLSMIPQLSQQAADTQQRDNDNEQAAVDTALRMKEIQNAAKAKTPAS